MCEPGNSDLFNGLLKCVRVRVQWRFRGTENTEQPMRRRAAPHGVSLVQKLSVTYLRVRFDSYVFVVACGKRMFIFFSKDVKVSHLQFSLNTNQLHYFYCPCGGD